jgi:hypothetical protein
MIAPRFCPACGTETTPPYRFCPGCGQALGGVSQPPPAIAITDPLFQFKAPDLQFDVYTTRIEVAKGMFLKRPEVIPIRQVASVETRPGGYLMIKTTDGQKREVWLGQKMKAAHQVLLSLL